MKNQKGITLIALVITIIVLLILAGVTIAMLTGENGLLNKSKGSAAATSVAAVQEEISLEFQSQMADYLEAKYTPNKTVTPVAMADVVKKVTGSETGSADYKGCKVTVSGEAVTIMSPKDAASTDKADAVKTGTITNNVLGWE